MGRSGVHYRCLVLLLIEKSQTYPLLRPMLCFKLHLRSARMCTVELLEPPDKIMLATLEEPASHPR